MKKIQQNDEVIVIAGKNKGARGQVREVLKDDRVIVSGVNLVKKHQKPNPNLNRQGGIIEKEAPLHVSNVAIFNSATEKADRVGIRFEDGKKVRFFKSSGQTI
ncbi:MAG: 50S ribosomal protein L24 [Pseudomonadota bacterium]|nr:50S ribosomal protein L24 [Pseudomonadota bacterium]